MAKRFINPDWKILRKLSPDLQRAFFYCWDKADACGVYDYDETYLSADLGVSIKFDDLKNLPSVKILPGEKIFFSDFIEVNYGKLKEGYNPHKPAFRALEKNKISSLNQACPKLEEEGEEEDKDKEDLRKQGFTVIECGDPANDIKVINAYGDLPPDGLLACALEALNYGSGDTSRLQFAKLVTAASLKNLKK